MADHKTYFGRYYVLFVVTLLTVQQNIAWVTFSGIADVAKSSYGLTDDEITLLPAYSPICFVLLTFPFIWFLQKFGMRVVGIGSAWILAIGCTIRVFVPYGATASKWIWLMHIGHIMIGAVGLPVMILPPKVSSVWFPPRERTFATSVAVTAESLGGAFGFIINPYLTQQFDVRTMLYVQAELAVFIALLFTIYFPPHPPTPPSTSAQEKRISFKHSIKLLFSNHAYIILVLSGGIVIGASYGVMSVLSVILNSKDGFNDLVVVDSVEDFLRSTSWLGAVACTLGTISGQITGFFADRFQRRFKLILLTLLLPTTGFFLWFSLSLYGWGSSNPVNLFVSFCLTYVFSFASLPIFYEAAVEATYPVSEGTSGGLLTLSVNIATLLFAIIGIAGVFSDSHPERAKAMSWTTTGLSALATILILFYMENYKRLNVDENKEAPEDDIKKLEGQDSNNESGDNGSIKINTHSKTGPSEKTPLINQ